MNLHAPERQPGETQSQYKERRKRSKLATKIAIGGRSPSLLDRPRKSLKKAAGR